jgi:hypothetical protein
MTFAARFLSRLSRASAELDPCGGPRAHPRGDCLHCAAVCARFREGAPLNTQAVVQAFGGLAVLACDQQRPIGNASVRQSTPQVGGQGVPGATGRVWRGQKLGGAL